MSRKQRKQVLAMLEQAHALLEQASAAAAAGKLEHAVALAVAGELLAAQARALDAQIARHWSLLGVGVVGWRRWQFGCGVFNAFLALWNIDGGNWWQAACNVLAVVVTARWVIPSTNEQG